MYDLIKIPSPCFNTRKSSIQGIVAHCLGYPSLWECLHSLTQGRVSAHYLVPAMSMAHIQQKAKEALAEQPDFAALGPQWPATWPAFFHKVLTTFAHYPSHYPEAVPVIQLVHPDQRAWHAGLSQWRTWGDPDRRMSEGRVGYSVNSTTVGIEFHCPGYALGTPLDLYHFSPYPKLQYATGIALIHDLMTRYGLKRDCLVGHSDVAWHRPLGQEKTDPGPTFFWQELAKHGLGYLPTPLPTVPQFPTIRAKIRWIQERLFTIGYRHFAITGFFCEATLRILNAYRMHFLVEEKNLISLQLKPEEAMTDLLLQTLSGHEAIV